MKTTYQPTKIGKVLYDITMSGAKFFAKHRWLYYVLLFTWGSIMTLAGCLISLILLCCGRKPYKYGLTWFFTVGGPNWGGLELGLPFICDTGCRFKSLCDHEMGHSVQNAIFGPFTIFISFLPSAFRYWYRELKYKKVSPPTKYDDIWFEKSASDGGTLLHDYLVIMNKWSDEMDKNKSIKKK